MDLTDEKLRDAIEDEVCAVMMDHGPDGHVDGSEWLTDLVLRRMKDAQCSFSAEMVEIIYAAWHGAGVDIAGGNWARFVGMLPRA